MGERPAPIGIARKPQGVGATDLSRLTVAQPTNNTTSRETFQMPTSFGCAWFNCANSVP